MEGVTEGGREGGRKRERGARKCVVSGATGVEL